MTQLIDGNKLVEDLKGKKLSCDVCPHVEVAISKQTAPLTKEQFLAEVKGMGCEIYPYVIKITECIQLNLYSEKEIILETSTEIEGYNQTTSEQTYRTYRQALTVIQALMQAEWGE